MISDGPENLTCAGDLARGLAAVAAEETRIVDALERALDSLVPYLVGPDVRVGVKSGELLGLVYHQAVLLREGARSLAVAVCSAPPERPDRVAEAVAAVWRRWMRMGRVWINSFLKRAHLLCRTGPVACYAD